MTSKNAKEFLKNASKTASLLKSIMAQKNRIKINTHTDPDGIAAGCIIAKCLKNYDVPFHISFQGPPDEKQMKGLKKQEYDSFIFLDQGTGQKDLIMEHLVKENKQVIVLDHHPGETKNENNLHILNPHEFEIDGSTEISASGVTFSVIKEIDKKFQSLSHIALIGAIGDRQKIKGEFVGINQKFLEEAIKKDYLIEKKGLKIPKFHTDKIFKCITGSINPYIGGITGREKKVKKLFKKINIDPNLSPKDLDKKTEEKILNKILENTSSKQKNHLKNQLWGKIYSKKEKNNENYLYEYVTILRACDKLEKKGIGLSALLGEKKSIKKSIEIWNNYRKKITKTLSKIEKKENKIKEMSNIQYIDLGKKEGSQLISEIISKALESRIIKCNKPILGLRLTKDEEVKISARTTKKHSKKGLDLGKVMSKASKEFGGSGGGHATAAGAKISPKIKKEFLEKINRLLEKTNKGK